MLGKRFLFEALVLQRGVGFISSIATIIGFCWIKNRAVMCRYNGVHITHATTTYLNCVSIKYFVE